MCLYTMWHFTERKNNLDKQDSLQWNQDEILQWFEQTTLRYKKLKHSLLRHGVFPARSISCEKAVIAWVLLKMRYSCLQKCNDVKLTPTCGFFERAAPVFRLDKNTKTLMDPVLFASPYLSQQMFAVHSVLWWNKPCIYPDSANWRPFSEHNAAADKMWISNFRSFFIAGNGGGEARNAFTTGRKLMRQMIKNIPRQTL